MRHLPVTKLGHRSAATYMPASACQGGMKRRRRESSVMKLPAPIPTRHIGVCNFTASELERAHAITSHAHWAAITSNQVHYSLAARDIEHEVAPVAHQHDM